MAPGKMPHKFFLQLIVAIVKIFGDVSDSDEGHQALRILNVIKRQLSQAKTGCNGTSTAAVLDLHDPKAAVQGCRYSCPDGDEQREHD